MSLTRKLALPLILLLLAYAFWQSSNIKQNAAGVAVFPLGMLALSGIGFLFLCIEFMKVGFEAFQESIYLSVYAVPGFKGLLPYTLIGVVATVIMQSSHATLVLIITALAAQQITYENALALSIGANTGTTVTAAIGSLADH